eukprot:COSAG05_NODE_1221_length_5476_cov_72.306305_9_plen_146_part_00
MEAAVEQKEAALLVWNVQAELESASAKLAEIEILRGELQSAIEQKAEQTGRAVALTEDLKAAELKVEELSSEHDERATAHAAALSQTEASLEASTAELETAHAAVIAALRVEGEEAVLAAQAAATEQHEEAVCSLSQVYMHLTIS